MSTNPNDYLMGSGVPAAKFTQLGDTITGKVVATRMSQQTDYETGNPLAWANGDPRMQLVVTLQTSERDPSVDSDDGQRALYVKGSTRSGSGSMHAAVADAVRAAGAKGLDVGGTLAVRHTGTAPNANPRLNDSKLFEARYTPPNASGAFLGTGPQDQPRQPAQQPAQRNTVAQDAWSQPAAPPPEWSQPQPAAAPSDAQREPVGASAMSGGVPTEDQMARFRAWQESQQQTG